MDARDAQFAEAGARPQPIGEEDFGFLVREALRGAGGSLLFTMTVGPDGERVHMAAASLGTGDARRLLLISMPESGGDLVTEPVAESTSPVARIAESYAGLAEVLAA
jgi:hypothetical protein